MRFALALVALAACGGSSDPSTSTDAPPADSAPGSDASADGSAGCGAAMHECNGSCVSLGTSCGETVPDACPQGDECGADATCIDGACVCADGFRACPVGCCPVDLDVSTLDGAWADDVRLAVAPDGTAYVLADQRVSPSSFDYQLHLYARPAGGVLADMGFTIPVAYYARIADFAIASDGTLMIVYTTGGPVEFVTWKNGAAASPVMLGDDGGDGVSVAIAPDDTLWAAWDNSYSGITAVSLDTGGTRRSYTIAATASSETDVAYDPATQGMYVFYGSRYTGSFLSGVAPLAGAPALTVTCPADTAAFDDGGHLWAVYNSYSSIHTYACRDGTSLEADDPAFAGSDEVFEDPRIALDGEGTAFLASYAPYAYAATWWSSRTNAGWAHGAIPTHFGLPAGSNTPAQAHTALAKDPYGRMVVVVVPEYADMGAMVIATFVD